MNSYEHGGTTCSNFFIILMNFIQYDYLLFNINWINEEILLQINNLQKNLISILLFFLTSAMYIILNLMPIFEYYEIRNKSNFSKIKKEKQALSSKNQSPPWRLRNCFRKKGIPSYRSSLALYQPVFCKRRSSCTTDERNIAADFDRNVYSWSALIYMCTPTRKQALAISFATGREERGRRILPEELFARIYRPAPPPRETTSLLPAVERLKYAKWYFCPANVATKRSLKKTRPRSRRKRVREALDFKTV